MAELDDDVLEEVERLTRLEREAVDPEEAAAYRERRETLLTPEGFTTRVRESDDTLVVHPDEWLEDGVVRMDHIDDTDRAEEIPLSGGGDAEAWAAVEEHNAELVAAVEAEHGDPHAANARAFADFMGNHYARRVETATAGELREFLREYYPRNAWPSAEQKAEVARSLELLFDAAGAELPDYS